MRIFRRLTLVLLIMATLGVGPASANEVPVTATIISGSRTLTSVSLGTMASVLRSATTSATLTAIVTETAADGLDPWSVTARLCGPNNVTTPTAADCTTYPDRLVKAGDASLTIPGTAVTISGRTVTPVAGGGTSAPVSGSSDMSATRTLFTNTGEVSSSLYNGVYTATASIGINAPSNASAGAYNGFLVVTLVG